MVGHPNSEPRISQEKASGQNTDTETENIRMNAPEIDISQADGKPVSEYGSG